MDYSKEFTIFTDGSALSNSKGAKAGCAFYVPLTKTLISKSMIGTNNQAELEAISYALWFVEKNIENYIYKKLYIFSDSKYSIDLLTGKSKPKLNVELVRSVVGALGRVRKVYDVEFVHVMAHTNKTDFMSINNAIVDKQARLKASEA